LGGLGELDVFLFVVRTLRGATDGDERSSGERAGDEQAKPGHGDLLGDCSPAILFLLPSDLNP
jgi:hypothetical protein